MIRTVVGFHVNSEIPYLDFPRLSQNRANFASPLSPSSLLSTLCWNIHHYNLDDAVPNTTNRPPL